MTGEVLKGRAAKRGFAPMEGIPEGDSLGGMMPISVESEKCSGCKLCIVACPEPNVICFNPDEKIVSVDPDRCKICRLCIEACPEEAIEIQ